VKQVVIGMCLVLALLRPSSLFPFSSLLVFASPSTPSSPPHSDTSAAASVERIAREELEATIYMPGDGRIEESTPITPVEVAPATQEAPVPVAAALPPSSIEPAATAAAIEPPVESTVVEPAVAEANQSVQDVASSATSDTSAAALGSAEPLPDATNTSIVNATEIVPAENATVLAPTPAVEEPLPTAPVAPVESSTNVTLPEVAASANATLTEAVANASVNVPIPPPLTQITNETAAVVAVTNETIPAAAAVVPAPLEENLTAPAVPAAPTVVVSPPAPLAPPVIPSVLLPSPPVPLKEEIPRLDAYKATVLEIVAEKKGKKEKQKRKMEAEEAAAAATASEAAAQTANGNGDSHPPSSTTGAAQTATQTQDAAKSDLASTPAGSVPSDPPKPSSSSAPPSPLPPVDPSLPSLNADRDRFNYAAFDAGAKLLSTSEGMKKGNSILIADDDRYMMVPCTHPSKTFVIQLSEDIILDEIELANFEHYASSIKEFEVLGSATHPTTSWMQLGTFLALPTTQKQLFSLPGKEWVRFIKIRWISHYGEEYYCTLTYLKVYGMTMLETFREEMQNSEKDVSEIKEELIHIKPLANSMEKEQEEETPIAAQIAAIVAPSVTAPAPTPVLSSLLSSLLLPSLPPQPSSRPRPSSFYESERKPVSMSSDAPVQATQVAVTETQAKQDIATVTPNATGAPVEQPIEAVVTATSESTLVVAMVESMGTNSSVLVNATTSILANVVEPVTAAIPSPSSSIDSTAAPLVAASNRTSIDVATSNRAVPAHPVESVLSKEDSAARNASDPVMSSPAAAVPVTVPAAVISEAAPSTEAKQAASVPTPATAAQPAASAASAPATIPAVTPAAPPQAAPPAAAAPTVTPSVIIPPAPATSMPTAPVASTVVSPSTFSTLSSDPALLAEAQAIVERISNPAPHAVPDATVAAAVKEIPKPSSSSGSGSSGGGGGQQSIFKALTNRIKELEIHQALANNYVSDLADRYVKDMASLKVKMDGMVLEMAAHVARNEKQWQDGWALMNHTAAGVQADNQKVLGAMREQLEEAQYFVGLVESIIQVQLGLTALLILGYFLGKSLWSLLKSLARCLFPRRKPQQKPRAVRSKSTPNLLALAGDLATSQESPLTAEKTMSRKSSQAQIVHPLSARDRNQQSNHQRAMSVAAPPRPGVPRYPSVSASSSPLFGSFRRSPASAGVSFDVASQFRNEAAHGERSEEYFLEQYAEQEKEGGQELSVKTEDSPPPLEPRRRSILIRRSSQEEEGHPATVAASASGVKIEPGLQPSPNASPPSSKRSSRGSGLLARWMGSPAAAVESSVSPAAVAAVTTVPQTKLEGLDKTDEPFPTETSTTAIDARRSRSQTLPSPLLKSFFGGLKSVAGSTITFLGRNRSGSRSSSGDSPNASGPQETLSAGAIGAAKVRSGSQPAILVSANSADSVDSPLRQPLSAPARHLRQSTSPPMRSSAPSHVIHEAEDSLSLLPPLSPIAASPLPTPAAVPNPQAFKFDLGFTEGSKKSQELDVTVKQEAE
jgi:hypothetical protein